MRSNRIDKALYGRKYADLLCSSEPVIVTVENSALCGQINHSEQSRPAAFQIANPSNIFDNVGYLHNLACEFYMSSYSPSDSSVGTIITAMSQFLTQEFGFKNVEERIGKKARLVIDLVSKVDSPDFNISNGHRSKDAIVLESTDVAFLNEVLNKFTTNLNKVNSDSDFQQAIEKVKHDESVIINRTSLTIDQKFLMLASTSVMRYSADLWFRIGSDTNNPWVPPSAVGRRWFNPSVFGADVVGAYTANQISLSATGAAIGAGFFGIGAAAGYLGTMAAVGAGVSLTRALG